MNIASTNFYVTGGTLRHDAPSYVRRKADEDLFEGLRAGEFCYVLTSRQMGKSSLMVRTAMRLRDEGYHVAVLDLTAVGQNLTAEQWYDGLLGRLGRQLGVEEELEDYWLSNQRMGPMLRFFSALHDVVLSRFDEQLVIFVDEIDAVRSLPFSTDEFFAAIRECYNRRSQDESYRRITFCLLGVATPTDLIKDVRTTPFNIGKRIELTDFSEEEATLLEEGLNREEGIARALLKRVLYWTGGQPYLTQRLCQAVAEDATITGPAGVDRLCEQLFLSTRARERDDNLLFVRDRILRGTTEGEEGGEAENKLAGILDLYLRVRERRQVRDDETNPFVGILRLSGIVRAIEGYLWVRNRIYYRVFDKAWVMANMPDAEKRRQKEAERRAWRKAAAIVVVMAVLALAATGFAVKAMITTRDLEAAQGTLKQVRDEVRVSENKRQDSELQASRVREEANKDLEESRRERDQAAAEMANLQSQTNALRAEGVRAKGEAEKARAALEQAKAEALKAQNAVTEASKLVEQLKRNAREAMLNMTDQGIDFYSAIGQSERALPYLAKRLELGETVNDVQKGYDLVFKSMHLIAGTQETPGPIESMEFTGDFEVVGLDSKGSIVAMSPTAIAKRISVPGVESAGDLLTWAAVKDGEEFVVVGSRSLILLDKAGEQKQIVKIPQPDSIGFGTDPVRTRDEELIVGRTRTRQSAPKGSRIVETFAAIDSNTGNATIIRPDGKGFAWAHGKGDLTDFEIQIPQENSEKQAAGPKMADYIGIRPDGGLIIFSYRGKLYGHEREMKRTIEFKNALFEDERITHVAFDASHPSWFAIGTDKGHVGVWDSNAPDSEFYFAADFAQAINRLQFAPSEKALILATSSDGTARVYNLEDVESEPLPMVHTGAVTYGSFSPSGDRVLTVEEVATGNRIVSYVRVWDANNGLPLTGALRHGTRVTDAALSRDGKVLATATDDGLVRFWLVAPYGPFAGQTLTEQQIRDLACALSRFRLNERFENEFMGHEEVERAWQNLFGELESWYATIDFGFNLDPYLDEAARLSAQVGDWVAASGFLTLLVKRGASDDSVIQRLLESANGNFRIESYDTAIQAYTTVLEFKKTTDIADVFVSRGESYLELEKNEEAIRDYRKALELEPTNARAHFGLGKAYILTESPEYALAIEHLTEAIDSKQNEPLYYVFRAEAYMMNQPHEYSKALADYAKAIDGLGIAHPFVYRRRAEAHVGLAQKSEDSASLHWEAAMEDIEMAIKESPSDRYLREIKAGFLAEQAKWDAAATEFQRVAKAAYDVDLYEVGNRSTYKATLAKVVSGDMASASEMSRSLFETESKADDLYWSLHLAAAHPQVVPESTWADLLARAKVIFDENPDNTIAAYLLGGIQLRMGYAEAALRTLVPVATEPPRQSSVPALLLLAMAYYQVGDANEGRQYYDQAIKWLDSDPYAEPCILHYTWEDRLIASVLRAEAEKKYGK